MFLVFQFFNAWVSGTCTQILTENSQLHENDEVFLCGLTADIRDSNIGNVCLTFQDVQNIYSESCFENKFECIQYLETCRSFDQELMSCLKIGVENFCAYFETIHLNYVKNFTRKFNYTECNLNKELLIRLVLKNKFDKSFCTFSRKDFLLVSTSYSEFIEKGNYTISCKLI